MLSDTILKILVISKYVLVFPFIRNCKDLLPLTRSSAFFILPVSKSQFPRLKNVGRVKRLLKDLETCPLCNCYSWHDAKSKRTRRSFPD